MSQVKVLKTLTLKFTPRLRAKIRAIFFMVFTPFFQNQYFHFIAFTVIKFLLIRTYTFIIFIATLAALLSTFSSNT